MLQFDAPKVMGAASVSAAAAPTLSAAPAAASRAPGRPLSSEAEKVAAEAIAPAYSPIVLAGIVRIIDVVAIAVIGLAIHLVHVFPTYGFAWYYAGAFVGIAVLAVLAFQAADIYDVQRFRTPMSQITRLGMAWTIVFLIAMATAFFAKFEGMFSRVWLAGTYGAGFLALIGFRIILAAWCGTGRTKAGSSGAPWRWAAARPANP